MNTGLGLGAGGSARRIDLDRQEIDAAMDRLPAKGVVAALGQLITDPLADRQGGRRMTDGMRTSEFWLSVLVIVAITVLVAIDRVTAEVGVPAIAGAGGFYAVSRGIRKAGGNGT